jgi:hypothetical protein
VNNLSDKEFDDCLVECVELIRRLCNVNNWDRVPPGLMLVFDYGDERVKRIMGIGSDIPEEHREKMELYKEIGRGVAKNWSGVAIEAVFWFSEIRFTDAESGKFEPYEFFLLKIPGETEREEALMISGMTPDGRNNGAMAYIDRLQDDTIILQDFDITRCGEFEVVQDNILTAFYDGYGSYSEE